MVDPRPHLGPPIGTAISDTGAQTPEYTATLDGAAITAGLPLMRRAVLPAGVRQIRLWAGFGNVEPDDMIDLVQRNGEVTGRQLYWFKNPSEYDTLMPGGHDFQFRFAQRIKECGDVRRRDADTTEDGFTHWITCSAAPSRDAKWARLWNQIDSLGVWSLPSDTTLIQYRGIVHTDGVSLVVELREGDRYRTYSYSDPGGQPAPQAAFANRISRLVLEATRFSLRPDPDSAR
jgi:hypothetical protein